MLATIPRGAVRGPYFRTYTDPARPTWKIRTLLLALMDPRLERELDRIDRFFSHVVALHQNCPCRHAEVLHG